MADIKNNGGAHNDSDLKLQDLEKSKGFFSTIPGAENKFSKPASADAFKSIKKVKKSKVPVAVDIIVAVLLLAIICGAALGGYYLFRYFTVDYESVNVTYVFAVPKAMLEEGKAYSDMNNDYLYYDVDGNTFAFGRIRSAEISSKNGMLLLTVEVNAKYRAQEGYSIDELALAVGKSYTLHTDSMLIDGTVVELYGKK